MPETFHQLCFAKESECVKRRISLRTIGVRENGRIALFMECCYPMLKKSLEININQEGNCNEGRKENKY